MSGMDYKGDLYYIGKVLGGNTIAYSYLVDRHKDKAFNLAFRICGNREEAEEVSQDAFLKAYRSLKGFRMKSSFETWLYRIVYNTAVSLVRSRKQRVLSVEDFPADVIDFLSYNPNTDQAVNEFRNSLINFALQKITAEERALISLYYYDEKDTSDISEITGISKSNVKVKLFRARQKMIEIIAKVEKKNFIYYE
jgi:RNA polymerase sigma-70 factor (ECF subfamily)